MFTCNILADINYKDFTCAIYYNSQLVAILNQEKGLESLEIEIYPPLDREHWVFKLADFNQAIQDAKKLLIGTKLLK